MKKRIVTFLLVSALAAAVFTGCGKSGGDAADAAATGEAAVTEEAVEAGAEEAGAEDAAAASTEAVAEEAGAAETAASAVETAAISATEAAEIAAEEFVDEEKDAAEAEEAPAETADEAAAEETEDLIVDPGTQYTVRFGGNIYATPDQTDANVIDYVYPGYVLQIDERLEDFWYHVSYWIDGAVRTGYIKIQ